MCWNSMKSMNMCGWTSDRRLIPYFAEWEAQAMIWEAVRGKRGDNGDAGYDLGINIKLTALNIHTFIFLRFLATLWVKNRNVYINEIDRISIIRDGKNKTNSYLVVGYLVTKWTKVKGWQLSRPQIFQKITQLDIWAKKNIHWKHVKRDYFRYFFNNVNASKSINWVLFCQNLKKCAKF